MEEKQRVYVVMAGDCENQDVIGVYANEKHAEVANEILQIGNSTHWVTPMDIITEPPAKCKMFMFDGLITNDTVTYMNIETDDIQHEDTADDQYIKFTQKYKNAVMISAQRLFDRTKETHQEFILRITKEIGRAYYDWKKKEME